MSLINRWTLILYKRFNSKKKHSPLSKMVFDELNNCVIFQFIGQLKITGKSAQVLLFGRGPNRVMETACFDANVQ